MASREDAPLLNLLCKGLVQGVGFRPYVYALACELDLSGYVQNGPEGVLIRVEGKRAGEFLERLPLELPPHARLDALVQLEEGPQAQAQAGVSSFRILPSEDQGEVSALVLPDLATCPDCLGELKDPADRRFRYPFLNCTRCGPRYSILESLPYDRARTAMKSFELCEECRAEYEDPANRRFHAQPTACPECGPRLRLLGAGRELATHEEALDEAIRLLAGGEVLAVKGIGGFHLMGLAQSEEAIQKIRRLKGRPSQALAVMVRDPAMAREIAHLSEVEEELLTSSEAPILLLHRRDHLPGNLAPSSLAPRNHEIGVMLPYSPLHHLLMEGVGAPLVATSANRSGEPLAASLEELKERMDPLPNYMLDHDRPILRPVDDSLVRVILDRRQILRRARGFSPLPIELPEGIEDHDSELVALGAQQKNALAWLKGGKVFLGPHLGDLESLAAQENQEACYQGLGALLGAKPGLAVRDLHPGYHRLETGLPCKEIQHHEAHLYALLLEQGIPKRAMGLSWDGTGLGTDGSLWGGEVFLMEGGPNEGKAMDERRLPYRLTRLMGLRPFALIGGEAAIREPKRIAHALLRGAELEPSKSPHAWDQLLERGLNCPQTSSMGRLFDGISAWLGICEHVTHEGQAAMELEYFAREAHRAGGGKTASPYPLPHALGREAGIDWRPLVREMAKDLEEGASIGLVSLRFHESLARLALTLAQELEVDQVYLSGGCFLNRLLTERIAANLEAAGVRVVIHERLPPGDGNIAAGQALGALLSRF